MRDAAINPRFRYYVTRGTWNGQPFVVVDRETGKKQGFDSHDAARLFVKVRNNPEATA